MRAFQLPGPAPHRCLQPGGGQCSQARSTVLSHACPGSRTVAARGLLDSYRAEKASATAAEEGDGESPNKKQKFTRHPRSVSDGDCEGEDGLCTPDCVQEVFTAAEFDEVLARENPASLIVVDFYKTACGSCRYILPGFVKLCRSSEEEHAPVVFLKHNIIDAADQETDLCERLGIRNVPLFQFWRNGELLEQFATREKRRIGAAINAHVGREVCHF